MNSKLTVFGLCLLLVVGCSPVSPSSSGTWRASVDNGDKPGIGIDLTRAANGISGFIFLLNPNKPHNFAAGSRRLMEIHRSTETEIYFAVQWLPTQREEMVLRLAAPLTEDSVRGELQSVGGKDTPRIYNFTRAR